MSEQGVWVSDLDRPGVLTPLVRNGEADYAQWSPDGRQVAFQWRTGRAGAIGVKASDGTDSGPPETFGAGQGIPSCFTPNGRQIIAVRDRTFDDQDIVAVSLERGQTKVQGLIETSNNEAYPELSPDGRWLAFVSNKSSRDEVYVMPYPAGAARQVSIEGGNNPAWNPKGTELFYVSLATPTVPPHLMAVPFMPGSSSLTGVPRPLFPVTGMVFRCTVVRCYDVARDGQTFYAFKGAAPQSEPVVTHIKLIENWFEELKAKVPVR